MFETKPFYEEGWYLQTPLSLVLESVYPNSKFKIVVIMSSLRLIIESSFLNKVYLCCIGSLWYVDYF